MQQFLKIEWEAIAGIMAALIALVMHFLHVVDEEVLLVIAVVLLSLSFIRDLRRERLNEHMRTSLEQTERGVHDTYVHPYLLISGEWRQQKAAG